MWKPRWSGFYRSTLDSHLQDLGIDTVVMAGCNFPNCPHTTIFDASERDYRVVIAHDAAPAEDGGTRLWLPMLDGTDRVGGLGVTVQDVDDLLRHTARCLAGLIAEVLVTKGNYTDLLFAAAAARRAWPRRCIGTCSRR